MPGCTGSGGSLVQGSGDSHLVVMLIETIISIQHSINLQYIAVGIRSYSRIQSNSKKCTEDSKDLGTYFLFHQSKG